MTDRIDAVFESVMNTRIAGRHPEQVRAETVAGWDSLRHMELLLALEKAFQIRFSVTEMIGMRSLAEIHHVITTKTGTQPAR